MIAPGVYFGLPEEEYHADPALGSTDIKRLYQGAPYYWEDSALNPNREEQEEKRHFEFGRAVHRCVLEGRQAMTARYDRAPDPEGLLSSDADLAEWLDRHGVEKLPRSKAAKIEKALEIDPSVRIKDVIEASAADAGRVILAARDYDRILAALDIITRNPDLATAFEGGEPEVSVFWNTRAPGGTEPIRVKARFDYLKVRGVGDLKSIANKYGDPFPSACRRAIAGLHYDLQAAHYLAARAALPDLVAAGAVTGDHDPEWLSRVAACEEFAWQWVFFQSTGALAVWSCAVSPGNPILDIGAKKIERALETFSAYRAAVPAGERWLLNEPVRELELSELPGWYGRD